MNNSKTYFRKYHNNRHLQIKKHIWKLKTDALCLDCGHNFNPWVMQFDHRVSGDKKFEIARSHSYGWDRILEEIEKCDIVCANCHADRTYKRRQDEIAKNPVQLNLREVA